MSESQIRAWAGVQDTSPVAGEVDSVRLLQEWHAFPGNHFTRETNPRHLGMEQVMSLSLSKPSAGHVGWAASINQNWTDIENAFNSSIVSSQPTDATLAGPSSAADLHTCTVPAGALAATGDYLDVTINALGTQGNPAKFTHALSLNGQTIQSQDLQIQAGTVRIIRTGSTTARVIRTTGVYADITGLSWGSAQTLKTLVSSSMDTGDAITERVFMAVKGVQ